MVFHHTLATYKDDFPLLIQYGNQVCIPIGYNLENIFKSHILELSDTTMLSKFTYIARHTNDDLSNDILIKFQEKFPELAITKKSEGIFRIPTVWLTCYLKVKNDITHIEEIISKKGIKYFTKNTQKYESFDLIPPDNNYTQTKYEARTFPKFLHQVTQIGINLMDSDNYIKELQKFKPLEWRQNTNERVLMSLISELEEILKSKSAYYKDQISENNLEKDEFWENFKRVHVKNGMIFSWPHFLFNICGIA